VDEVTEIEDGHQFEGEGFLLKVIHTPGHSPGGICLYEPRQKVLFSGDHIIKHITPNPLIEIKREFLRDPLYQSLKAYNRSLDKLADLEVRYIFSGHGEYMEDLGAMVDLYHKHHRERMELIWRALHKQSRPLYQIIGEVFPFVPEGEGFLAISELLVHLEIMMEEGRAELADPGPPAMYRAL
jgi:glyoxylase-like metal-dependent hydrolase (beta-lactamase superfamily II)